MNTEIFELLKKCNSQIISVKNKINEQEKKIENIESNSDDFKKYLDNLRKKVNEINNYFYYLIKGKNSYSFERDDNSKNKKNSNECKKEVINFNDNLESILNDLLPNMKKNANEINKSLINQEKNIDKSESNIFDSINSIKKINKII